MLVWVVEKIKWRNSYVVTEKKKDYKNERKIEPEHQIISPCNSREVGWVSSLFINRRYINSRKWRKKKSATENVMVECVPWMFKDGSCVFSLSVFSKYSVLWTKQHDYVGWFCSFVPAYTELNYDTEQTRGVSEIAVRGEGINLQILKTKAG